MVNWWCFSSSLQLGIFEGTDAAWEDADYSYTWEGEFLGLLLILIHLKLLLLLLALRKDFEVDQRFKDLSMKIDLIKEDAR